MNLIDVYAVDVYRDTMLLVLLVSLLGSEEEASQDGIVTSEDADT